MKKFEELKKLAEKHLDYDYDVETLKQYCELEPQEIEYINMTNPATILALLADREQLRRTLEEDVKVIGRFLDRLTLEAVAQPKLSTALLGMLESMNCYKRARAALKKSDEVDE